MNHKIQQDDKLFCISLLLLLKSWITFEGGTFEYYINKVFTVKKKERERKKITHTVGRVIKY